MQKTILNDHSIFKAFLDRDAAALSACLTLLPGVDSAFDPLSPGVPDKHMAGSIVGLCSSVRWHDGLRVCRDLGLNPNRNSMIRDPFIWAFANDDKTALEILVEMQFDATRLMPDDRLWGIDRAADRLEASHLEKIRGDVRYGDLDLAMLAAYLKNRIGVDLRPVFGYISLNKPIQNSLVFYDRMTASADLIANADCRHFAHYAYFKAEMSGRRDIGELLLDRFGFEPDFAVVEDRLGHPLCGSLGVRFGEGRRGRAEAAN